MKLKAMCFFTFQIFFQSFLYIYGQTAGVISVYPKQNEIGTPRELVIEVKFYEALDSSSIKENLFNVYGENSNIHSGKVIYEKENTIVKFIPENNFFAGEVVKVCFGPVKSLTGEIIKAYHWQFTVGITNKTNAKFKPPVELPLNSQYVQAIDIDRNGTIDLISIEGYVLYNQGDGIFSEPVFEPMYEQAVFFCDLNNDTYLDIIKENYGYSTVFICNENGQYQISDTLSGDYGIVCGLGDFNNDGLTDLIGAGYGWKILFNDGKGHFKEDSIAFHDAKCFNDLEILDLNNDGLLDYVVLVMSGLGCESNFDGIFVYSNDGNGYFNYYKKFRAIYHAFLQKLHIADFNNDSFTDVAACGMTTGGVVLFNDKTGGYISTISDTGGFSYFERPIYFSAGDMNGDNKIDIVLTNSFVPGMPDTSAMYGEVQINYGGEISYFSHRDSIQGGEFVIGKIGELHLTNICLADLDNDGDLDVIHVGAPTFISYNDNISSGIKGDRISSIFSLSQNYPNPFNPNTTIIYYLSEVANIELKIYDIMGREIRTLISDHNQAGYKEVVWNGTNDAGVQVSSGIYLYRLVVKSLEDGKIFEKSAKMIMMK